MRSCVPPHAVPCEDLLAVPYAPPHTIICTPPHAVPCVALHAVPYMPFTALRLLSSVADAGHCRPGGRNGCGRWPWLLPEERGCAAEPGVLLNQVC